MRFPLVAAADLTDDDFLAGIGRLQCRGDTQRRGSGSRTFDKRTPIIDTNVKRLMMRLLAIRGKATPIHDKTIYKFLDKIMPKKGNNIFNQSLMELGALVCRNQEPLCSMCPIKDECKAYKLGIQELIPERVSKKIKDIDVVIAVLKRKNCYFSRCFI